MPRKPTILEAFAPLLVMTFLIGLCSVYLKMDFEIILLLATFFAAFMALRLGYSYQDILDAYVQKIAKAFPALLILIAIGAIVGTWMFSGTVPMLIYYGLKWLDPRFVVAMAFFVTSVVSLFTGTSWGSAATAGIAFIGIAEGLNVPLPMVAGAVVGGAYLGDKLSPISDTTNLSALASEVNVYDHVKSMLANCGLSFLLSMIIYIIVGFNNVSSETVLSTDVSKMLSDLDLIYNFNIILLLPAIIVFGGAIKGYNPLLLMLISSFIATILGVVFNGFSIVDATGSFVRGFNVSMVEKVGIDPTQISPTLFSLLNRGGMAGMMSGALLFAFIAMAFGSFIEKAGCLQVIIDYIKKFVKSAYSLIVVTFIAGLITIMVTSNGQFTFLTIGQIFKDSFKERKINRTLLSRTLENSVTMPDAMFPFTVSGIYMANTLGVAVMDFLPWLLFNFFSMTLFLGFFAPREIKKQLKYAQNI